MKNLAALLRVEAIKAIRSRMPLFTLLGFMLAPVVDAFFMLIFKDPELARSSGLISSKAQLMVGSADWPTFLSFLAQAVAVGGILLFGLIASWVFGREFVDGTVKDLLSVPVARESILFAKFVIVALWSLCLTLAIYLIALLLGFLLEAISKRDDYGLILKKGRNHGHHGRTMGGSARASTETDK